MHKILCEVKNKKNFQNVEKMLKNSRFAHLKIFLSGKQRSYQWRQYWNVRLIIHPKRTYFNFEMIHTRVIVFDNILLNFFDIWELTMTSLINLTFRLSNVRNLEFSPEKMESSSINTKHIQKEKFFHGQIFFSMVSEI